MKLPLILLAFIFIPFLGCESSENVCEEIQPIVLDFSNLEDVVIESEEKEDNFLVINSEDEFLNKVSISINNQNNFNPFDINFSESTLLIGKVRLAGIEGQKLEERVELCESGRTEYILKIKNGGYAAIGLFYFGVIIPKTMEENVVFNISVSSNN